MAEYGHRLITETYALLGPGTELAVSGNRLACPSYHLNGGTKPFAAPYVGLTGMFPMYSGRDNRVDTYISLRRTQQRTGPAGRGAVGRTCTKESFLNSIVEDRYIDHKHMLRIPLTTVETFISRYKYMMI